MPAGSGERQGMASISSMVDVERSRIIAGVTPEQRERMGEAERARAVYHAWNTVCAGTREGEHVTGLKFLPDTNELLVYLDGSVWTQEMMMLREIIRARMERAGAKIDGFVFRTSREGYQASEAARRVAAPSSRVPTPAPRAELTEVEARAIEDKVAPIEDRKLWESLKMAISASVEWKKGREAQNKA